jgi:hypothetical protein
VAVDRNTQINFQGDPAKEKAFIEAQDERTTDGARASEPQAVIPDETLSKTIAAADPLNPEQGEGFEHPDSPPGAGTGANVNSEFEENRGGIAEGTQDPGESDEPEQAGESPTEEPETNTVERPEEIAGV